MTEEETIDKLEKENHLLKIRIDECEAQIENLEKKLSIKDDCLKSIADEAKRVWCET